MEANMSEIWHESWPPGWDEQRVRALQDRFFCDVEAVMQELSPLAPRKRIVLLSGGTDSLLLLAVARHLWPGEPLTALTIHGRDTPDFQSACAVARYFGVEHSILSLTAETILDHIALAREKGYIRFPQLMFHICFELCLREHCVSGCVLYEGNGADIMQGSTEERIYQHAEKVAQDEGISLDEARTRAKIAHYLDRQTDRRGTGSGTIFKLIAEKQGAVPVTPFGDPRFEYMTRIPYSVLSPLDKRFVKDGLRRRYGLDDIVERPRIPMQRGTGLEEETSDLLLARYSDLGKTPNEIVKVLTAPIGAGGSLASSHQGGSLNREGSSRVVI
jgi:asparagine synthetase B (glutamine-hydrolysing)